MKRLIFLFIAMLYFLPVTAEDLLSVSVVVTSKEQLPVSGATVSIGDMSSITDNNGRAMFSLFPALYDISISKQNYYKKTGQIDVTRENFSFGFEIESALTRLNIKIVDSFTGLSVQTTVKINDSANNFTYASSSSSGDVVYDIEKNNSFIFEVNEKNYKPFSYKIDTGKLMSSNILFKLDREESNVSFSFNVPDGTVLLYLSETGSFYKEYSFSNKTVSVKLPFGIYDTEIKATNYKPLKKSISVSSGAQIEDISLVPNFKDIYLYPIEEDSDGIKSFASLPQLPVEKFPAKTLFTLYKNGAAINSFSIERDNILKNIYKLTVVYDTYDLVFSGESTETFTVKNMVINENTLPYFIVSLKQIYASLKGSLKLDSTMLGGINLQIISSDGVIYGTTTDINGEFFIKLPPKEYNIFINKDGYRFKGQNTSFPVQKLSPGDLVSLDLTAEEIPSVITGKITNLDGTPVANARITMKMDKEEAVYYSKDDGTYQGFTKSGLVILRVEKPGYKAKGTIKTVNRFSTVPGLDFKLEELLSSIDGTVTDGTSPVKGLALYLIDADTKAVVLKTTTLETGKFLFENVPIMRNYVIKADSADHVPYESKIIEIKTQDPVKGANILLKKNSVSFLLELKDSTNLPLPNKKIIIDSVEVISDVNGIVNADIKTLNSSVNISVPEYSYKETVAIPADSTTIKKEIIIIKENTPK